MTSWITCNFQSIFHVGSITSFCSHQFSVDIFLWRHFIRPFSISLLRTPLYISIHCDYLALIILAVCLVALLRCLLCVRLLTNQWIFTTRFIFFSFLISVGYHFFHRFIGRLARFRFLFLDLFLACCLTFDCCLCCSLCHSSRLCERFSFQILPFCVRFSSAVGACVEPRGQ